MCVTIEAAMSDQEPEKNNPINFIAVTVESMRDQMSDLRLDSIDRTLRARLDQIETEMSRLRRRSTMKVVRNLSQVWC